jgi:hypothetical protein
MGKESDKYFDAISATVKMAKTGSHFAQQAAQLCERRTLRPVSSQELKVSLASMLKLATKAMGEAKSAEEEFGRVRVGLITVNNSFVASINSPLISTCCRFAAIFSHIWLMSELAPPAQTIPQMASTITP